MYLCLLAGPKMYLSCVVLVARSRVCACICICMPSVCQARADVNDIPPAVLSFFIRRANDSTIIDCYSVSIVC